MQSKWIFALNQKLSETDSLRLSESLGHELGQWKAHGTPVQGRFEIREGQFLFIEALSDASGCSLDWMHRTVAEATQRLGLELAGAEQVFFRQAGGEVSSLDFRNVGQALTEGRLKPDTLILDSTVVNQNTFEGWEKPLSASWLSRYLVKV